MTTEITRLNNGMRVVSHHMPHLETVSLGVWVGVGARHHCGRSVAALRLCSGWRGKFRGSGVIGGRLGRRLGFRAARREDHPGEGRILN